MSEKALLITSNAAVADPLMLALRKEPFALVHATSAGDAMVTMAREQFDVVIVDDDGGGMPAGDLLEDLARKHGHIPRIFLVAQADVNTLLAAVNRGQVFRALRKPCNADELAVAIRSALRKSHIAALNDRAMGLARRQVTLLEELDREAAAAGERAPGSHMAATGELPAVSSHASASGGNEEIDPVAMLTPSESASLSRREKELLRAVVAGKKPRALARTFFISVHTVRNHIKAIYRKLSVHSQGELIAKVLRAPGRRDYRSAS